MKRECLLLRLNSRSARGASHHPVFMGNCPTISRTFFSPIYSVDEFYLREMRVWSQSKISSYVFFIWCESSLLLRLKSRSERGVSHHLAFMGNCPTISHIFFALSTQWMSSPSTEWGRGVSPRFHIIAFVLVWIKRIKRHGELLWGEWGGLQVHQIRGRRLVYKEVVEALSNYKKS